MASSRTVVFTVVGCFAIPDRKNQAAWLCLTLVGYPSFSWGFQLGLVGLEIGQTKTRQLWLKNQAYSTNYWLFWTIVLCCFKMIVACFLCNIWSLQIFVSEKQTNLNINICFFNLGRYVISRLYNKYYIVKQNKAFTLPIIVI